MDHKKSNYGISCIFTGYFTNSELGFDLLHLLIFPGIALYGLYEPLLLTLANRNLKGDELVNGLTEVEQFLDGALRHLKVEPPESPEGRLAVAAFAQLADVRERLQTAQLSLADASRRKNKKKKRK